MRPRITFANVVSVIALFVALGGTAIATHPGGQNTISTADIINGQVRTDDIGNGEVKIADIGQGAVATDEIANGQVKTADIGSGEVRTANVANDNLTGGDVAPNSLKGADIDESTLTNIGGGGAAGGDLTGTYPNPQIAANAVGSSEVIDNSLGSLDVHEESMLFNNTLNSNDIGNDAVGAAEIASSAVGSAEVADSSLNDEDIGEGTFVNFTANIGTVPAQDCVDRFVTGAGGFGDHLVLTANWQDSNSNLEYTPQHSAITGNPSQNAVAIHVCNPTTSAIDDTNTRFNLLVIDAQ